MSPSPEELAAVAGAADARSVVSDEICPLAVGAETGLVVLDEICPVFGPADAGSVISDEARPVAGGADTGLGLSEPVDGGPDADSVISDEFRALACGADRGCVSVLLSVSSAPGDDVFRASVAAVSNRPSLVDVRRSPLRNRRQVSELLCSGAAVSLVTAGFAPNELLVSTSSCPVTASPLRTW
jgi:hypothetical protein